LLCSPVRLGAWGWQMARNDEEKILSLEKEAAQLGYSVVEQLSMFQSGSLFQFRDQSVLQRHM
jgi:hypothetical protein